MNFRIRLARNIVRLGDVIASLAIMVMRPQDLVEFTRQDYGTDSYVSCYAREGFVEQGLTREETLLLEKLPLTSGRLLVMGMGGGRDAIALARLGFQVVGTDFIPAMVERALENAGQAGVELEGVVQDFSDLRLPPASFDAAVLFAGMYSSVPTRHRRIAMLRRVREVLKPGGYFVCQFFYQKDPNPRRGAEWARKALALLTWGNFTYERGDTLFGNRDFYHYFIGEEEVAREFAAAGLKVVALEINPTRNFSGAVLQAPEPGSR